MSTIKVQDLDTVVKSRQGNQSDDQLYLDECRYLSGEDFLIDEDQDDELFLARYSPSSR